MPEKAQHRTKVLRKCGFHQKNRKGRAPEEKWVLEVDGVLKVYTSLPRGRGEIRRGTFSKILSQMRLTRVEYDPIYSCKKRRPYYEAILRERGVDI